MNKAQAIQHFWESFGVPAYSSETVPDNPPSDKYITYDVSTDSVDHPVVLSASVWDIGTTSWVWASSLVEDISDELVQVKTIPLDIGYLYLTRGTPFAQRMQDENDSVRRIYLNVMAEYLAP